MKMTTVMNEWRDMVIDVVTDKDNTMQITVPVYGCFAVHSGWGKHSDTWTITHVPTGWLIEHYSCRKFQRAEIQLIAERMQRRYASSWNTESRDKARQLMVNCADIWNVPEQAVQS